MYFAVSDLSSTFEACKEAGAEAVVDHRLSDVAEAVLDATDGEPVDRIVDVEFGANLDTAMSAIRVGGTIATYSSTVVPEPKLPFFQMMYNQFNRESQSEILFISLF